MARKFIGDADGKFKVKFVDDAGDPLAWFLWGDSVDVISTQGDWAEVTGRGIFDHDAPAPRTLKKGWIPKSVLVDEGLLEIYIIDVGQGDGVLMRTPDDAWHVIDAGVANEKQMTKKGAANFIRWKFQDDLQRPGVDLESVIVTHPDFDHYGGLLDLLAGKVMRPDRTFPVSVEHFYHSGMGRFDASPKLGQVVSGSVAPLAFDDYRVNQDGKFITELLDGKTSFKSPSRDLDDTFARLAKLVGTVPKHVNRLSHRDEYLPGYSPADGGDVSIRILGPILEDVIGKGPGLRILGNESETRNGHSVVLRVDYDQIRVLLTGDLNTASQRLLLSYHPLTEFNSDVAKGCHHGSDDIDLRFVRAMKARATVISSGDNEDYAHPRPRVLGASARYGREAKSTDGETLPPLLYSTELARSVKLAYARSVQEDGGPSIPAERVKVVPDVSPRKAIALAETPISTDLIYGLINVRTDGKRMVCAYMEEQGKDFDIKAFRGGVEP